MRCVSPCLAWGNMRPRSRGSLAMMGLLVCQRRSCNDGRFSKSENGISNSRWRAPMPSQHHEDCIVFAMKHRVPMQTQPHAITPILQPNMQDATCKSSLLLGLERILQELLGQSKCLLPRPLVSTFVWEGLSRPSAATQANNIVQASALVLHRYWPLCCCCGMGLLKLCRLGRGSGRWALRRSRSRCIGCRCLIRSPT